MSISIGTAIKAIVEGFNFNTDDGGPFPRHIPVYAVGTRAYSNRVPEVRDRVYPYLTVDEFVSDRPDPSDNQLGSDSKIRHTQEIQVDLIQQYLDPVSQARVEQKTLPLQIISLLVGDSLDTKASPLPSRAYACTFVGMHMPPEQDKNTIHHVMMFDVYRNMR